MFFLRLFFSMVLICSFIFTSTISYAKEERLLQKEAKISTWLWNTQEIVKDTEKIMEYLVENNVSTVYLQVDYDIKANVYKKFIKKATENNISIYALEGSFQWASENGSTIRKHFFDWLTQYQESAEVEERFKGIHLDVEPYINPEYTVNPNKVLEQYQGCLSSVVDYGNTLGLPIAIDVPFWFDEVYYKTKYGEGILIQWIMENIKDINIMAYRDFAIGQNGIQQITEKEIELAKQYDVKVTIAVETGKSNEGKFITFYEEGKRHMFKELNKIYEFYKEESSFNGFAIHHLGSWRTLKK